MSGVFPSPGPKKQFPERLASRLEGRFSRVSAESLRVRRPRGFVVPSVRRRLEIGEPVEARGRRLLKCHWRANFSVVGYFYSDGHVEEIPAHSIRAR